MAVNETLTRGAGHLHLNLFLPGAPDGKAAVDLVSVLRQIAQKRAPHLTYVADSAGKAPEGPWYYAQVVTDKAKLPRMSAEYIQFKGRTLSPTERAAAMAPGSLLLIGFVLPRQTFLKDFQAANEIGESAARAVRALIQDDDTRDIMSPDSWKAARLRRPNDVLIVGDHLAVHLYRRGEYLRAVTLGMSKFGLPELAIDELISTENGPAGNLINILAQRLFESPLTVRNGSATVALSDLPESSWRSGMQASLVAPAVGTGSICLYDAKPEPGDADNRLLRIGFELSAGPDRHAQRYGFFAAMFGYKSSPVINASAFDKELLDASRAAKARIPELRAALQAGLPPGERLYIKSPFSANGNTEYMWIEVTRWDGRGIAGLLTSEPRYVKSLRSGQEILIQEADFYDYLVEKASGATEGNETGRLLERRSKR